MREKKKGPAADQLTGPKGEAKAKAKAKHILKDRRKELDSQEAKLFLRFLESHPPGDVSLAALELLWGFLKWMEERRLYVVGADEIFHIPFSNLVRGRDLK